MLNKGKYLGRLIAVAVALMAIVGCQPAAQSTGVATSTGEAQTYRWKLVTSWPKNFPGLGIGPERFAQKVEAMSAGRLKIKVYGAGELVPALQVFDAVSQGTAEMGHSGAYYWKGKSPATQFFTSVPFGLTAIEMNGWIQYGGGQALWEELYAPFNLIPMPGGNTGVQMGGWFNKEINSVADLQGLKMRIPGLGGEVLAKAGGTPVTLPGGELFTALQTGAIDATEWVGPYNDLAFGLFKVAKHYYYPGWQEPGPMLEFTINKTAFDELPTDLQAIIRSAAADINQDMLAEYTARNQQALVDLTEKHQVQVKAFPDDVMTTLAGISDGVLKDIGATDELSQRIYDSYISYRDAVTQYHAITEKAYINAR